MKEIKSFTTSKILVFALDELDCSSFRRPEFIQEMEKKYKLRYMKIPENMPLPVNLISFRDGEIEYEKRIYQILDLNIEDRRIIVRLTGPTKILDLFIEQLKKILTKYDLRETKGRYEPIISTNETVAILKLDFTYFDLIKGSPLEIFYKKMKKRFNDFGGKYNFEPSSVKFRLSYFDLPEKFIKNSITISEKELLIEHRLKTDPKDKIFFTASPVDSETHFDILKQLENIISETKNN